MELYRVHLRCWKSPWFCNLYKLKSTLSIFCVWSKSKYQCKLVSPSLWQRLFPFLSSRIQLGQHRLRWKTRFAYFPLHRSKFILWSSDQWDVSVSDTWIFQESCFKESWLIWEMCSSVIKCSHDELCPSSHFGQWRGHEVGHDVQKVIKWHYRTFLMIVKSLYHYEPFTLEYFFNVKEKYTTNIFMLLFYFMQSI